MTEKDNFKMIDWQPNYMATLPLDLQFVKVFLSQLQKGALNCGDIMPSVKVISERSLVNAAIIAEAYEELKKNGWIVESVRGHVVARFAY